MMELVTNKYNISKDIVHFPFYSYFCWINCSAQSAFHYCDEIPKTFSLEEDGFILDPVSELSDHGWLVPFPGSWGNTEHHGGRSQGSKAAHLMAVRKLRERKKQGTMLVPKDTCQELPTSTWSHCLTTHMVWTHQWVKPLTRFVLSWLSRLPNVPHQPCGAHFWSQS